MTDKARRGLVALYDIQPENSKVAKIPDGPYRLRHNFHIFYPLCEYKYSHLSHMTLTFELN